MATSTSTPTTTHTVLRAEGFSCPSCVAKIEKQVGRLKGVENVKVHFIGGTYEWKLEGKTEYLASIRASFHNRSVGHHNGHQPEIEMLSATEATGVWYLTDNMWIMNREAFTTGTAIYWDRYVKEDGRWQIIDTKYERIYEQNEAQPEEPRFDYHYLGKYAAPPAS